MRLGQLLLEILSGNNFHTNQNDRHDLDNKAKVTIIEPRLKVVQMHLYTTLGEARLIISGDIERNLNVNGRRMPLGDII